MLRSFRVGRLFGFPIDINVSFLLLLAVAGLWMGGLAGIFVIVVAFSSILVHELGHALVARYLGVPIVGIELYFFGGAAKMAGQPKSAGDEIAIAAAGPAVSFVLGGLGMFLGAITGLEFLSLFAWINLVIGAFNLVPALPMDGGRILRAALSRKLGFVRATEMSIRVSRAFAIFLGLVGLLTAQLQLLVLAGVLWFLGNAELRAARLGGYDAPTWPSRQPQTSQAWSHRQAVDEQPEVMPKGAWQRPIGTWGQVHRPQPAGGFVIRHRGGGRFVIERL